MQELSLNLLDIAQNSVKAGAKEIALALLQKGSRLNIIVTDNGCGMTPEQVSRVTDPFFTSRTTRAVGLGVPFFKMAAEQTGGDFSIESTVGVGTVVKASFFTDHIDCMPLGNMADTLYVLMSCNEDINFVFSYSSEKGEFVTSSAELMEILDGVPLSEPSVATFLRAYFKENIEGISI